MNDKHTKTTTEFSNKKINMHLNRKLSAAIIAAFLFALLFCFIPGIKESIPNFTIKKNGSHFIELFPLYLLFFTPFFLIMGTLGTVIVDLLVSAFVKDRSKKIDFVLSFIFHAIFGFLMFEFGMIGIVLIFVVDRILSIRKENYSYLYPLGCLVLSAIIGTLVYFIFTIV
ncbi:hypothetical protein C2I27_18915 [Priestia megaterium]|uniref:hypothetical protein n=1 Tax=Priestia TaxID=2800373 RepID=UPI000D508018|nr:MULTISPECIES: hypothetical protein [Priestia]MBY0062143.1 hypothetical protein [Priestia aryabhattai]MDN3362713.1 hypothetical protein [Priestia megaterium]PVC65708.1 hypothetical protein C2I27_18915 [Priestia megaterium]TPF19130.1 hypothetical protein CBE78_07880 [Priestia megaterium]TPF23239.1 hypothetical protein CBE79_10390 [Priestia megaterium]